MKTTIYLRIAKGGRKGFKVSASTTPDHSPMIHKGGYKEGDVYLPTVSFGMNIDIDDQMFKQAETIVADINVAMKEGKINSEIVIPKGITIKVKK